MDGEVVALRHDFDDSVEIGEVNFGVDTLSIEVQGQVHQVDVACALPVTEQTPLDAIGTSELSELCGRNSSP